MTTSTAETKRLSRLPIFSGIPKHVLNQLVAISVVEKFDTNQVLIHQGKRGQNLWIILEGTCEVIKMTDTKPPYPINLAELGPHNHFGEMSFFHAAPHSATIQAVEPVTVLRIRRKDYDKLLHEGSEAAYLLALNCVDELADRLRRMDDWVTKLVCNIEDNHQTEREWTRFREKLFSRWNG